MQVVRDENGKWHVVEGGVIISPPFDTEEEAWDWYDKQ